MNHRAGWDIGGAHLKLALLSNDTLSVFQWSCPLWKGLHELVACLNVAFDQFPQGKHIHHITMTGELADIFDDRTDGVKQIINTFVQSMPANDELKVFANTEVVEVEQAMQRTHLIASANWLASGHYLSRIYANALFVDIGSTTTDILTVKDGKVCNVGFTDAERLRSGELVYTGVVRSCVNTLCNAMPYHNQLVPMMAENFATSADVYRILQQLPAHADSGETMDGQEKDKVAVADSLMKKLVAIEQFIPMVYLHVIDLRNMQDRTNVTVYYAQSVSMINYLIKSFGSRKFSRLCRELKSGKSFEDALKAKQA